jgi:hypothetical protein
MSGQTTTYDKADVMEQEWIMRDRIPENDVALVVGEGGTGKDICGAAIIAAVTQGWDMPDGSPAGRPSKVLMIHPEDKRHETVAPRLLAAGARMDYVIDCTRLTNGKFRNKFSLGKPGDDIGLLRQKIIEERNVRMLWISPLNAISLVATTSGQRVRDQVIGPLQDVCEDTGVGAALVHHTIKDGKTIAGSGQLRDALRCITMIRRDRSNEEVRVMTVDKNNIGLTDIPPLRFVIEGAQPFSAARFLASDVLETDAETTGDPKPGTGRFALLEALRAVGGPRTGKELAFDCGIPYHTARVLLSRLVDDGYVRRQERGVFQDAAVTTPLTRDNGSQGL